MMWNPAKGPLSQYRNIRSRGTAPLFRPAARLTGREQPLSPLKNSGVLKTKNTKTPIRVSVFLAAHRDDSTNKRPGNQPLSSAALSVFSQVKSLSFLPK